MVYRACENPCGLIVHLYCDMVVVSLMLFVSRIPSPPLHTAVESIWVCQNDPQPYKLQRVLPTGSAEIILNLKEDSIRVSDPERESVCEAGSGSVLCGPHSRHIVIDTAEQEFVVGVAFKPGGTTPFFRLPAYETSDAHVPLEAIWGKLRIAILRERLLASPNPQTKLAVMEDALTEMWCPQAAPHAAVAFALASFHAVPQLPIATIADRVGLSPKRFIERFKTDVGLTPKRYCRVMRFQKAVRSTRLDEAVDWCQLALDCGYFDQAHFIHDFRAFAGFTPNEYRTARTEFHNHVKFLQYETDAK